MTMFTLGLKFNNNSCKDGVMPSIDCPPIFSLRSMPCNNHCDYEWSIASIGPCNAIGCFFPGYMYIKSICLKVTIVMYVLHQNIVILILRKWTRYIDQNIKKFFIILLCTHTTTHTNIYIYIYIILFKIR